MYTKLYIQMQITHFDHKHERTLPCTGFSVANTMRTIQNKLTEKTGNIFTEHYVFSEHIITKSNNP